jgi:hypothetical protein
MRIIEHAIFVYHCPEHGYQCHYFRSNECGMCRHCMAECTLVMSIDPAAWLQVFLNGDADERARQVKNVSMKGDNHAKRE